MTTNTIDANKLVDLLDTLTEALKNGGVVIDSGSMERGGPAVHMREPVTLEPGLYTLTKDIENPAGDRRVTKDFDRIAIWPKGARVAVRKTFGQKGKRTLSIQPHAPVIDTRQDKVIHADSGTVYNTSDGFSELANALAREAESVETVLEECGFENCVEALQSLVAGGKLTFDDIRKAKGP